jgi:signal transduction histidine kinase
MRASAPSPVPSTLLRDFMLALLVATLLFIGFGVSLEDEFEISLSSEGIGRWLPGPVGSLVVLAGALPLTFRKIAPLTVFGVVAAASLAYRTLGYTPEPLPLGVLVALYTVAVARQPLIASVAGVAYVLVLTLEAVTGWLPITDDQYYIYLVSVVATVMLGYGVALGRAGASLAEQRAAGLARDQDARMRSAVAQEQARIAREVHDIVAHDVSVIVAQARAAQRVFNSQPQAAVHALGAIEAVGRDALDGLRGLVTLLRTDLGRSDRRPQPSLDRLPWLLTQVQSAGQPVELTIRGRPRPLSATVELNAFRIVQEALTNILKHAGPTQATVVLDYGESQLRLEVRDRGVGGAQNSSVGYGLISMHQRAAMLGGELVAGPAESGFVVTAWLPTEGPNRRPADDSEGSQPAPARRPLGEAVP